MASNRSMSRLFARVPRTGSGTMLRTALLPDEYEDEEEDSSSDEEEDVDEDTEENKAERRLVRRAAALAQKERQRKELAVCEVVKRRNIKESSMPDWVREELIEYINNLVHNPIALSEATTQLSKKQLRRKDLVQKWGDSIATRFMVMAATPEEEVVFGTQFFEEPPVNLLCALRYIGNGLLLPMMSMDGGVSASSTSSSATSSSSSPILKSPQGRQILGVELDMGGSCSVLSEDMDRKALLRALRNIVPAETLRLATKDELCGLYTQHITQLLQSTAVSEFANCSTRAISDDQYMENRNLARQLGLPTEIDTGRVALCKAIHTRLNHLRSKRSYWNQFTGWASDNKKAIVITVAALAAMALTYVYREEVKSGANSAYEIATGIERKRREFALDEEREKNQLERKLKEDRESLERRQKQATAEAAFAEARHKQYLENISELNAQKLKRDEAAKLTTVDQGAFGGLFGTTTTTTFAPGYVPSSVPDSEISRLTQEATYTGSGLTSEEKVEAVVDDTDAMPRPNK